MSRIITTKKDNRKDVVMILVSTQNYLISALLFAKMYYAKSPKYPLVCAIPEELAGLKNISLLKKYNIIPEIIKKMEYSDDFKKKVFENQKEKGFECNSGVDGYLSIASKMSILIDKSFIYKYRKICYIDSDVYLRDNLDYVLDNYDSGSIIKFRHENEYYKDVEITDLMATMFLFVPTYTLSETAKTLFEKTDTNDGCIVQYLFSINDANESTSIPLKYLANIHNIKYNFSEDDRIYHFWGKKPWLLSDEEMEYYYPKEDYKILYEEYMPVLKEIRAKEGV